MSTSSTVLKHVKGQKARFLYFRDDALVYRTDNGFLFQVPAADTGSATFNAVEDAMTLMRWIRKQVEANNREMARAM